MADRVPSEKRQGSVLGDINPEPSTRAHQDGDHPFRAEDDDADEAMQGGSKHDRTRHPGSRDVTEGTTGGTGTEVGGTRNYRQGTGASGGDIGNRPE